ncbi:hypothetical protein D068_cds22900 [Bacillus atrophaeus UCMB-5137]|nr:hypothetical protein D068_cds22900 [Bacillus atrophaeus UCMB-5137]
MHHSLSYTGKNKKGKEDALYLEGSLKRLFLCTSCFLPFCCFPELVLLVN